MLDLAARGFDLVVLVVSPVEVTRATVAPSPADDAAREERVKMTRLRQTIARRLKDAQNTAAMLTTFNEADMSAVMALRSRHKERFQKAHRVGSWLGLTPSRTQSGESDRQGAITKTGNARLRRLLLETAWHYRHHPYVGPKLRVRQRGAPSDVISRARAAQHRLSRTYRRLTGRGRPPQIAVTAVAIAYVGRGGWRRWLSLALGGELLPLTRGEISLGLRALDAPLPDGWGVPTLVADAVASAAFAMATSSPVGRPCPDTSPIAIATPPSGVGR